MPTYKVELTEKEAKNLGEKRWLEKNQWRFFRRLLVSAAALIGFCCLGTVFAFPDWANIPGVIVLGALTFFFLLRGTVQCTKAGKAFVQSLEKEK